MALLAAAARIVASEILFAIAERTRRVAMRVAGDLPESIGSGFEDVEFTSSGPVTPQAASMLAPRAPAVVPAERDEPLVGSVEERFRRKNGKAMGAG